MAVKLNSRSNIRVKINGEDYSKEVESVQASYSSLSLPGKGLCLMTGTIKLVQTRDTNTDFDTRFNPLWARGTPIEITHLNQPVPLVGKCYIIASNYDMSSTLTISIGCALSLYNFKTSQNAGICINFGQKLEVGTAVLNLILASGVPAGLLDIGPILDLNRFSFTEPYEVSSTTSLLQAAGAIFGQYGGFLIQRYDGSISFIEATEVEEYVHYHQAEQLQSYQRASQPETVISQFIYEYDLTQICSFLNTTSSSIRSGDTIVEVVENRDEVQRTTETTIKEFRDLQTSVELISTSTISSTFEGESDESASQPRSGEIVPLDECFPDSESRLLTRTSISTSDNTEVLKAWLATKATAIQATGFSISGTITSEKTTESYEYRPNSIKKISETFQAAGKAIPIIADVSLGRPNDPNYINDIDPTTLIIADKVIEIWTKAQDLCQKWNYVKTTYRNRNIASEQDLLKQIQDVSVPLQGIIDGAQQLIPISRESKYNQSPPRPETFAVDVEIAAVPEEIVVGTPPDGLFQVSKKVKLGAFSAADFDLDYFIAYCSALMDFYNGRIYGMTVSFSLFDIEDDWAFFLPMARTKVREPSEIRSDTASVFRIDSPALVISPTEAVLSYTGSFVGFSKQPNNTSIFNDVVQPPITLPTSRQFSTITLNSTYYNITS